MNLPKAIVILEDINNAQTSSKTADSIHAIKLGREALKRISKNRTGTYVSVHDRLPGETAD